MQTVRKLAASAPNRCSFSPNNQTCPALAGHFVEVTEMGNARRNWHHHWTVDFARWTVTHDSGLVVQFVDGVVFPQPTIGTHCAAEGVGEWTGWLLGGDDALVAWLKANPALREPSAFRSRITRLMDEAGRVWARKMADETKREGH